MIRRSPQTERLVEIVEFLVRSPEQEYRLADLARLVGLDKATCYPMLTELTRVGWLVKNRTKKTYRLGPRLVAVGSAAAASLRIAEAARPDITLLSTQTRGMVCLILPSSDDLVIAEIARPANGHSLDLPIQAGDRVEFCPPLGAVLIAWANLHSVDRWLRRDQDFVDDPARCWHSLRLIRRRHFAVELSPISTLHLQSLTREVIGEVFGSRRAHRIAGSQTSALSSRLLLADIDPAASYCPLAVSAACFDAAGTAVAAVSALGDGRSLTGNELDGLGQLVAETSDRITRSIEGRAPWDPPRTSRI